MPKNIIGKIWSIIDSSLMTGSSYSDLPQLAIEYMDGMIQRTTEILILVIAASSWTLS